MDKTVVGAAPLVDGVDETVHQNLPPDTRTYFILAATDQEVVVTKDEKDAASKVEQ